MKKLFLSRQAALAFDATSSPATNHQHHHHQQHHHLQHLHRSDGSYGLSPPDSHMAAYAPSAVQGVSASLYNSNASMDSNDAAGYPQSLGTRRTSATTTYGSIEDVVDDEEEEEEDDNPF